MKYLFLFFLLIQINACQTNDIKNQSLAKSNSDKLPKVAWQKHELNIEWNKCEKYYFEDDPNDIPQRRCNTSFNFYLIKVKAGEGKYDLVFEQDEKIWLELPFFFKNQMFNILEKMTFWSHTNKNMLILNVNTFNIDNYNKDDEHQFYQVITKINKNEICVVEVLKYTTQLSPAEISSYSKKTCQLQKRT